MPTAFQSPVTQPDLTHVDLSRVKFDLDNEEVSASVGVGTMEPGFSLRRVIEFRWTQAQVIANLTTEERQALASIRSKIIAHVEGLL